MNMGRGIVNMGKSQGGMRVVETGSVNMAKAVDASWWLSGGISPDAVAGVWQPKGAASLDASYLRLAGDENYADIDPAVVGGVAPTWDAVNGWIHIKTSSQYLKTGIIPTFGYSAVIRYTGLGPEDAQALFGCLATSPSVTRFEIMKRSTPVLRYEYETTLSSGTNAESGVVALTKDAGYLNGIIDVDINALALTNPLEIYIGATNLNGSPQYYSGYKVQAIAFYKSTLTAPQVLAVSTAMAAL